MTPERRSDVLEIYESGIDVLKEAVADVPREAWNFAPAPGEWTVIEILNHIADMERVFAVRFGYLLCEQEPEIQPLDPDSWTAPMHHADVDPDLALAATVSMRRHVVAQLRALSDDQWKAAGTHPEFGVYRLEYAVEYVAPHLHDHAQQIRNNYERYQEVQQ